MLQIGAQIFTKRPVDGDQGSKMNPEDVVTYLQKHSHALVLYLEHLVLDQHVQVGAPELGHNGPGCDDEPHQPLSWDTTDQGVMSHISGAVSGATNRTKL